MYKVLFSIYETRVNKAWWKKTSTADAGMCPWCLCVLSNVQTGVFQGQCDVHRARSFWEAKCVSTQIHLDASFSHCEYAHSSLHLRLRAHCRRRAKKTWEFAVRVSPIMSEATSTKSPTWLPKHKLNENNRHANMHWGKSVRRQPYTQNYRQLRKAESRRNSLPWEELTIWLSNTKWSSLKTYKKLHYTDLADCIEECVYTYTHKYT